MKKIALIISVGVFFFNLSNAQIDKQYADSLSKFQTKVSDKINWGALINRDEVALRTNRYNLYNIQKNTLVRVRFYKDETQISGINTLYRDKDVPFVQTDEGRVVSVKAINGGYAVYIMAGDVSKSFTDLVTLKGWASGTSFIVLGNVTDLDN